MSHDQNRAASAPGKQPPTDIVAETRRNIDDLNQRIIRQQRRVDKIILDRVGPREDMEALLDDMIKARDIMQEQLDGFSQPVRSVSGRG